MPPDEYASTTRGTLKLKGVKDSKVDKKKKKKKKAEDTEGPARETELSAAPQGGEGALDNEGARQSSEARDGEDKDAIVGAGKTEAEIRHEDMRKKRVGCPACSQKRQRGYSADSGDHSLTND
jgi:FAM32A